MKPTIKRHAIALAVIVIFLAVCLLVEWAAIVIPAAALTLAGALLVGWVLTEKDFQNGKEAVRHGRK